MSSPANLLIVTCSQAKSKLQGDIPALDRYDGPVFRLIRKYMRSVSQSEIPHIEVLSAKFGLINVNHKIPLYDQRMTIERAEELRPLVISRLQGIVAERSPDEIFLSLSNLYERALSGLSDFLPVSTITITSKGMPGKKLSELYAWLYGRPAQQNLGKPFRTSSKVVFRGNEIKLSPLEVMDIGRKQLANNPNGSDRFQAWCVIIDGIPVSTKWLVSQITDLPLSKFGGTEARKLLQRLGIKVENR